MDSKTKSKDYFSIFVNWFSSLGSDKPSINKINGVISNINDVFRMKILEARFKNNLLFLRNRPKESGEVPNRDEGEECKSIIME